MADTAAKRLRLRGKGILYAPKGASMSPAVLPLKSTGGSPTSYVLTCAAGAYNLSGVAASLKVAHALTCAAGSYGYTGVATSLKVAHNLQCSTGAYALTGNAATLTYTAGASKVDYTLVCGAGSYAYSGVASSLKVAHSLTCDAGAYNYSGVAASLKVAHSLICDAGSYSYTGIAASLKVAHSLACNAGAYALSGSDAPLTYVAGAAEVIEPAGAGHPAAIWWGETKIKRGKHLDAVLKKAMQRMIEDEIELAPETAAAKAVEIVKPFVETTKQEVSIDWKAVEQDLKKVKELLALWQKQMEDLEDEEMLLMMMAN